MSKFIESVFRALTLAVQALVALVFVLVAIWLWNAFFWSRNVEFTYSNLVSASESDLLVTSIAQVDLIWFKTRNSEYRPSELGSTIIGGVFKNAREVCLHSYEVTFGYASLAAERARARAGESIVDPEVMTINALRSESAPDSATKWCQEKNTQVKRTELKAQIKHVLTLDGVLHHHLVGGRQILTMMLDLENPDCVDKPTETQGCLSAKLARELTTIRDDDPPGAIPMGQDAVEDEFASMLSLVDSIDATEEAAVQAENKKQYELLAGNALARANYAGSQQAASMALERGGQLAVVNLTFSTIIGAAQERKRFLGLWREKRFYLQKDVSHAYYGATLSPNALLGESYLFRPSTTVVELEMPHLIAIDRATEFIVARGDIENVDKDQQSLSHYLNNEVLKSLDESIRRYHDSAVRMSMDILKARIRSMVSQRDQYYEIRFRRRPTAEQVLDVLPQVVVPQVPTGT